MERDESWDDPQLSDGDMGYSEKNLVVKEINRTNHKVLFGDRLIGHFIMDIDGYYYFDYVTAPNGLWTSYSLRMVADLLEEMNRPNENNIKEFFKSPL